MNLQVKTRHGPKMNDCVLLLRKTGSEADQEGRTPTAPDLALGSRGDVETRAHVRLAARDSGLAPGQFAAFYLGEECLGSGVISDPAPARHAMVENRIRRAMNG